MLNNRPRLAQIALVVVIVSMALPWAVGSVTVDSRAASELRLGAGYEFSEGRLVILTAIATIAAIQLAWRPAWIGAGLVVATLAREFVAFGDRNGLDPGSGLWVGIAAGVSATVILIWSMFSDVAANAPPKDLEQIPET